MIRVTVYLKLDGSTQSDYSNHSSLDFKRAFTAEIKSSGTAATDAAEFVKVLKEWPKGHEWTATITFDESNHPIMQSKWEKV